MEPLHIAQVAAWPVTEIMGAGFMEIVILLVAIHPLASETVNVYDVVVVGQTDGANDIDPFDQLSAHGTVPPLIVGVKVVHPPLQTAEPPELVRELTTRAAGWPRTTVAVAVDISLLSVTVTV